MPKRKLNLSNKPLITRPQRTIKPKKVFDQSDDRQQKKKSMKKNIKQDVKAKNLITNKSNDIVNVCPPTPVRSSVHSITSQKIKNICFICLKKTGQKKINRCPVCTIRVHKECLEIEEPTSRYKFDEFLWFCKQCKNRFCYKCLHGESQTVFERRCITCNLSLHLRCYEFYDVKPLQQIQADTYQCIPCLTLTNNRKKKEERNVEVKDVKKEDDEESLGSLVSNISCSSNDEDSYVDVENDDDSTSSSSIVSDSSKRFFNIGNTQDIPDITDWNKSQVYNYLLHRLPQEIVEQIYLKEYDGRAILLFQQKDISSLNMQLASALLFYKQVKILQTRKSCPSVHWE